MAILEAPNKQKVIASTILLTFVAAAIIFSVLLISCATQLSQSAGSLPAKLGPVTLFELTKTSVTGGSSGMIRFVTTGMLVYASFWLVVVMVVVMLRLKRNRT